MLCLKKFSDLLCRISSHLNQEMGMEPGAHVTCACVQECTQAFGINPDARGSGVNTLSVSAPLESDPHDVPMSRWELVFYVRRPSVCVAR